MTKEITIEFNELFEPVFSTKARYIDIWGGRGRGGSHFATDYFLFLITQPNYFRGYFMREVQGDIRGSLFRDFLDRIEECEDINEDEFLIKESSMHITYLPTGNTITSKGFKKSSGKSTAKLKSLAGATHIIIEECEEVSKNDFKKLDDSLRTIKGDIQVLRLFNPPPKDHWLIKDYYILQPSDQEGFYIAQPKDLPDLLSIHTTYLDNIKNINEKTIQKFESYKESDIEHYNVDVRGLIPEGVKGRVFKHFKPITSMPRLFDRIYGLDFGFSEDPTSLTELEIHNNKIICDELIYEPGLTNHAIYLRCKAFGITKADLIVADSAEPKSIKELQEYGLNVVPATKGPDSVKAGIKMLKECEVYVTERSKNLWFEHENYKYQLDSDGIPTGSPIDKFNHGMDSIRYAAYHKKHGGTKKTKYSGLV